MAGNQDMKKPGSKKGAEKSSVEAGKTYRYAIAEDG